MTLSFDAGRLANGRAFLSIRVGRLDLFAQRETAPAARYGFTRDAISGGTLDLPGWSVAWGAAA